MDKTQFNELISKLRGIEVEIGGVRKATNWLPLSVIISILMAGLGFYIGWTLASG